MASVFLSYDHRDAVSAKSIASALEAAGYSVWWDRHIRGGSEFSKAIEQALDQSEAVVVLWSENSIDSAWVRDEAATGRDTGRLVPVAIGVARPPLGFRQFQTIQLGKGKLDARSAGLQELIEAIDGVLPPSDAQPGARPVRPLQGKGLSRRAVGAGLVAAGVAGAAGYLFLGKAEPQASPEVEALLAQAWTAWTQGTYEGSNQAIGLYRRATVLAPDYADAWGFLACAYGDRAHGASGSEQSALRERAKAAGRRALELDPKNAYGRAAIAYAQPILGNWLEMEREFRRAENDQPGKWLISYSLALLLSRVGRLSEAAEMFGRLTGNAPTALQYQIHIQSLWGAGKLEEADRQLAEATAIYGTHPVIWVTQFNMLLFGGQPVAAIALAQDPAKRPTTLTDEDLQRRLAVARAFENRDPGQVQAAMDESLRQARQAAFAAVDAMQFASGIGRIDQGFEVAGAYFFSRGFAVLDRRATRDVTLDSRETRFLFLPPLQAMRADGRFRQLTEEIGLERYWREIGVQPDYRRG